MEEGGDTGDRHNPAGGHGIGSGLSLNLRAWLREVLGFRSGGIQSAMALVWRGPYSLTASCELDHAPHNTDVIYQGLREHSWAQRPMERPHCIVIFF